MKRKKIKDDWERIVYNYKRGYPQTKMADIYKCSKERIRQIIWHYTTPEERAKIKKKNKEDSKERRRIAKKEKNRKSYLKDRKKKAEHARNYYREKHNTIGRTDYWTEKEDNIIRNFYPGMALSDVTVMLKNRTKAGIIQRACSLKVKKNYDKREKAIKVNKKTNRKSSKV